MYICTAYLCSISSYTCCLLLHLLHLHADIYMSSTTTFASWTCWHVCMLSAIAFASWTYCPYKYMLSLIILAHAHIYTCCLPYFCFIHMMSNSCLLNPKACTLICISSLFVWCPLINICCPTLLLFHIDAVHSCMLTPLSACTFACPSTYHYAWDSSIDGSTLLHSSWSWVFRVDEIVRSPRRKSFWHLMK